VLFGGSNGGSTLGDTWLWNGSTWSTSLPLSLLPALNPPARTGASAATAPGNQQLVLFGGQSGGLFPGALNDTWSVTAVVPTPTPGPSTTVDPVPGSTTTSSATTTTSTTAAGPSGGASTTVSPTPKTTPAVTAPANLAVASPSVHAGGEVTISGSGFTPRAPITIMIDGVTVAKGSTYADGAGHFSATVVVPADIPTGSHDIQAHGSARSGGQAVLVAKVSITGPPGHHSWLQPALMVMLTLLVAGGAGVVLTASTRRHLQRPSG
jgi:hypothetical protein